MKKIKEEVIMEIGGHRKLSESREMTLADIAQIYAKLAQWASEILPETEPGTPRNEACVRILAKNRRFNSFPFAKKQCCHE